MADPVFNIPGLGGYARQSQLNREEEAGNLKQALQTQTLAEHFHGLEQEKKFREGLAKLGPNARAEDVIQLATQFAKPGESLHYLLGAETARSNRAATKEMALARLQQGAMQWKAGFDMRLQNAQREQNAERRRQMMAELSRERQQFDMLMRHAVAQAEGGEREYRTSVQTFLPEVPQLPSVTPPPQPAPGPQPTPVPSAANPQPSRLAGYPNWGAESAQGRAEQPLRDQKASQILMAEGGVDPSGQPGLSQDAWSSQQPGTALPASIGAPPVGAPAASRPTPPPPAQAFPEDMPPEIRALPPGKRNEWIASNRSQPLPVAERSRLEGATKDYSTLLSLAKSFRPSYTNFLGETAGNAENFARALPFLPLDPAMANWWRDMRAHVQNPERHALFGATLTPGEMTTYKGSTVHPGMRPKDLMDTIAVRLALQKAVLDRHVRSMSKRYKKDELEGIYGGPLPGEAPAELAPRREDLISRGQRLLTPLEDILGQ